MVNNVPIVGNLMGIEHVSADENNASNKISFEELSKTGDEPDLNKKQETYHFIYHKHDKDGTENIYNESGGSVNGVHNDGTAPNGSSYLYRISADPNNQSLSGLMLEDNFYNYDDQEYRLKYPEINYRSVNGLYKSPSDGKYYVYEDSYLNTADHDPEGKPLYHVNLNEVDRLNDGYGIEKEEIIKSEKKYVKDGTRDKGQPDIIEKGKDGVVKVTTLYKSTIPEGGTSEDAVFGKDVVRKTITEMKPTIVKVAAKDKVVTTPIPSPKKYVKDNTRIKGQPNIVSQGQDGSNTVTTTYDVNPTTGAITEVVGKPVIKQPTETIVKVAAKDKVVVKALPIVTEYRKDSQRKKGLPNLISEGIEGRETTTTTYNVNPQTGDVTEVVGKPVTILSTPKIIRVPAQDDSIVEEIPANKIYEADPSKDKGSESITVPGEKGKKVTPVTYDVNPKTGVITENRGTPIITPAGTTVVKVGTKSTTTVTPIPSPKKYVKDDTREKGSPDIETKGTDGSKTVTTTYQVNRDTGEVTGTDGTPVIVNPTETVIKVAAKDKVVEKEIPSRVRYVGDENKENSTDPVRTEGKKGKEVTTTTYAVDPKTGTISESTKVERTEEPTDTVVTIGTKPKVELIKDGNRTIERTTRYKVNEDTGEVVTTTTDKLIPNKVESSNGDGELPPVVEVPEFNGGVNGDLDGNAAINDVPEYTGPLAGNGLTGEGEMVEPPVVDVPEFDLNKLPKEVKEEPKQEVPNVGTGLNTFNDGRKKPAQATEIVPVASTKEEPKAETPKDVSTPVTLEQKNDEQGKQAPVQTASSKKEMKELPNTGTASNAALTLAGVTFAMFGTVMLAKKKD